MRVGVGWDMEMRVRPLIGRAAWLHIIAVGATIGRPSSTLSKRLPFVGELSPQGD